jgi:hypothetical protein
MMVVKSEVKVGKKWQLTTTTNMARASIPRDVLKFLFIEVLFAFLPPLIIIPIGVNVELWCSTCHPQR